MSRRIVSGIMLALLFICVSKPLCIMPLPILGSTGKIAEKTVWDTVSFQVYYRIVPVGGYAFPIKGYTTEKPLTLCLPIVAILTAVFTTIGRKTHKGLRGHCLARPF